MEDGSEEGLQLVDAREGQHQSFEKSFSPKKKSNYLPKTMLVAAS